MSFDYPLKDVKPEEGMSQEYAEQLALSAAAEKYFSDRYGVCEEPVYDFLFNTWVRSVRNIYGEYKYVTGSADRIFSGFFRIPLSGYAYTLDGNGSRFSSSGGSVDWLFLEAWTEKPEAAEVYLRDEGLLSPRQRILWKMACEYAIEHHKYNGGVRYPWWDRQWSGRGSE